MSLSDRAPNFDDMWIKLSKGIEHVYRGSQKLSRKAQLELYTLIYNYCTNTPGPRIGGNNRPTNVQDGANVVGAELYAKLKNYLKTYLEEIVEDPKLYVETILDIYTKSSKLVEEVFNNEPNFSAVLDKACVEFINNNAVTAVAGSSTKSSELLAQYRDTFLREGSNAIETMDLEEKFNQIMALISKSTAAGGLES